VIGWQASGFDGKLRCGIMPLTGMRPGDFIYFSTYALFGLVLPFSSFFFTLLKYYGLRLQHLSPHSITLVVIFVHLYEMYVCVQPSVHLFCYFHVLCFTRRSSTLIGSYYFQHQAKGPSKYIPALSPGKWGRWREDWVIALGDAHDRLELPTAAPMAYRSE
jgi:hypothetical protein